MSNILLSPKYGVNPSISVCFFCQEDKNEIVLPGRIPRKLYTEQDEEAPHRAVWNQEPCDKCKGYMEQGIILISVNEARSAGDTQNPYRTGGWVVVKDVVLERMRAVVNDQKLVDDILRKRVAFLPDEVWDLIGLPRGEKNDG